MINDSIKRLIKKNLTITAELFIMEVVQSNIDIEKLEDSQEIFAKLSRQSFKDAIVRIKDRVKMQVRDNIIEQSLLKPVIKDN